MRVGEPILLVEKRDYCPYERKPQSCARMNPPPTTSTMTGSGNSRFPFVYLVILLMLLCSVQNLLVKESRERTDHVCSKQRLKEPLYLQGLMEISYTQKFSLIPIPSPNCTGTKRRVEQESQPAHTAIFSSLHSVKAYISTVRFIFTQMIYLQLGFLDSWYSYMQSNVFQNSK